ncbi:MAG: hypothetical protein COB04_01650 [Gammaproteobacteria bacterium]|nr:MAG: hypothetical protein COB04_01650 [Gammaproteobacteria bacterium]
MNEINSSSNHADLIKPIPKQTSGVSQTPTSKPLNDTAEAEEVKTNKDIQEAGKARKQLSADHANQPTNRDLINDENIENTVEELNSYVQSLNRSIQFAYDREAGKTVITVTDEDTGKVIRRIPEDLLLELAKKMRDKEPIEMVNLHA